MLGYGRGCVGKDLITVDPHCWTQLVLWLVNATLQTNLVCRTTFTFVAKCSAINVDVPESAPDQEENVLLFHGYGWHGGFLNSLSNHPRQSMVHA